MFDDFEKLLSVDTAKLSENVDKDILREMQRANVSGSIYSSSAMKGISAVASNAIPIHARIVMDTLLRTASAHNVMVVKGNVEDFKDVVTRELRAEFDRLRKAVTQTATFKGGGMDRAAAHFLKELEHTADQEIQRQTSELNLIAVANEKRSKETPSSGPVFNIAGPVGVLQTGANSIGIANQTFDQGARDALQNALDKVLASLDSADDLPDRDEVKELVVEAKAEVAKPTPNKTRIRSFISGIGTAISYAPKLREAYDAVKYAGGLAGVQLP